MTVTISIGAASCGSAPKQLDAAEAPSVQTSDDCEQLGGPVEEPEWRKGQKRKDLLARTTAALVTANDRLEARDRCEKLQRDNLAKGAK